MRVLFVKQDHASPSGLVGDAFAALGWDVSEMLVVPESRYHSPGVTVTFPAAEAFDAVVLYGAPWSVYDSATIGTWVDDEIAFARTAIAAGVPVLGICFGGQLLAAAVGGSVSPAPTPEIGWATVDTRDGLIAAGPWFNWHYDRFAVPDGVPVLARSALAAQAFCAGRTLGLQFHPEVTTEVIESWMAAGGAAQLEEHGLDAAALLAQTRSLAGEASSRAHDLVLRFVTDVARRPAATVPEPMAASRHMLLSVRVSRTAGCDDDHARAITTRVVPGLSVLGVPHPILQALAIFAAGLAAGTINTVVGSGTLITFPTLLAFGYPPVLANVSNNVGLVPGVASGIHGYRAELRGQRSRLLRLVPASLAGGVVGAALLLVLPAGAFNTIVPVLIGLSLVMVVFQPRLSAWVAARQRARAARDGDPPGGGSGAGAGRAVADGPGKGKAAHAVDVAEPAGVTPTADAAGGPVLLVLVFLTGIYGGYFGAAQGVLLLGMLGVAFTDSLQRINAVKNVLAGAVNGVAAIVFIAATHIDWGAAALIACGAVLGGQLGARIGRRLPPWGLRAVIICVGTAALVKLLA